MSSVGSKKKIGIFIIIGLIIGIAGGLIALRKLGWRSEARSSIALLKDENWEVRRKAALDIADTKDPLAVEPLIECLNDKHWMVRWAVVDALGATADKRAVEPLINRLKDEYPLVRDATIRALGKIGERRAVDSLLPLLTDELAPSRLAAADVLTKLGWRPTTEAEQISYLIAQADWSELVKIGQPAVEPLIARLKDVDPRISANSARTLGMVGDKRAIQPLKDLLNRTADEYPDVQQTIGEAVEEALTKLEGEKFPLETPKVE